jgi:hypothetical protein
MTPVPPIGSAAVPPRRPQRGLAALAAVLLQAASPIACGYHLLGHSTTLPTGIQSVGIPTFVNRTNRP